MKPPHDTEPVVVDAINRGEPLVTDPLARELLETARAAVVVESGVGLEERRPAASVASLQRLDGGFYGWIRERARDHCSSLVLGKIYEERSAEAPLQRRVQPHAAEAQQEGLAIRGG